MQVFTSRLPSKGLIHSLREGGVRWVGWWAMTHPQQVPHLPWLLSICQEEYLIRKHTLRKLTSPLKNGFWETIRLPFGMVHFQGTFVSFRGYVFFLFATPLRIYMSPFQKESLVLPSAIFQLAFATEKVAPLRVARPGWSQDKQVYHCMVAGTELEKACHWLWNVKSTMRKAEIPKHNTDLDCMRKTLAGSARGCLKLEVSWKKPSQPLGENDLQLT